jgi:Flp pilus assembly protein TadD
MIGDNKLALSDFNSSIKINPKNEGTYMKRGILYSILGEKELAIIDLKKAVDLGVKYGSKLLKEDYNIDYP